MSKRVEKSWKSEQSIEKLLTQKPVDKNEKIECAGYLWIFEITSERRSNVRIDHKPIKFEQNWFRDI